MFFISNIYAIFALLREHGKKLDVEELGRSKTTECTVGKAGGWVMAKIFEIFLLAQKLISTLISLFTCKIKLI